MGCGCISSRCRSSKLLYFYFGFFSLHSMKFTIEHKTSRGSQIYTSSMKNDNKSNLLTKRTSYNQKTWILAHHKSHKHAHPVFTSFRLELFFPISISTISPSSAHSTYSTDQFGMRSTFSYSHWCQFLLWPNKRVIHKIFWTRYLNRFTRIGPPLCVTLHIWHLCYARKCNIQISSQDSGGPTSPRILCWFPYKIYFKSRF